MLYIFKLRIIIYIGLIASFIIFSLKIYLTPISPTSNIKFTKGKKVWQRNNCQACHQLYGLGGYLGPDLSLFAKKPAAKILLHGILMQGRNNMPSFDLSKVEQDNLWQFLLYTSKEYPPVSINNGNE